MAESTPPTVHSHMHSILKLDSAELGVCESPRVLSVLSSLLQRFVLRNENQIFSPSKNLKNQRFTVFHGRRPPSISIGKYLERIFKYANCSPSCFVVACIYLERLQHQQAGLPITALTVHRLLITSIMIATKFLEDTHYNNAYYAKVGGVMVLEMNRMELEFLFRMGFQLHVTVHDFNICCSKLESEVAVGGSHQIVRALRFQCGLNDSSVQEDAHMQRLIVGCSYVGV
eukprot:c18011_g2_i1 orf=248-934(-)